MAACFLMAPLCGYPYYNKYRSIGEAKEVFLKAATELHRYGQGYEAAIHIAKDLDQINEYPDYVLSLGKAGGLHCERA